MCAPCFLIPREPGWRMRRRRKGELDNLQLAPPLQTRAARTRLGMNRCRHTWELFAWMFGRWEPTSSHNERQNTTTNIKKPKMEKIMNRGCEAPLNHAAGHMCGTYTHGCPTMGTNKTPSTPKITQQEDNHEDHTGQPKRFSQSQASAQRKKVARTSQNQSERYKQHQNPSSPSRPKEQHTQPGLSNNPAF